MRALILGHRWLGLALAPLVILWFVSGLIMLFVPYPSLTDDEQLDHLQALDRAEVNYSPISAWRASEAHEALVPSRVRLTKLIGRPVYVFTSESGLRAIWADSARPVTVNQDLAVHNALTFKPAPGVQRVSLIKLDQWSFSGKLNPHRPLYKITLRDPAQTEVYVSSRTGEVVLESTQRERFWNWLGTVTHWLYFTELRAHREVWRQVVMWPSAIGMGVAIAGLVIGIRRMRITSHYSRQRHSPYAGLIRVHHLMGYSLGGLVISWLLSGWLSMTPMNWLSERSLSEQESSTWQGVLPPSANWPLPKQWPAGTQRLEWTYFDGSPVLIAQQGRQRHRLQPLTGQRLAPASLDRLTPVIQKLQPQSHLLALRRIPPEGDAYVRPGSKTVRLVRASFDDVSASSYDIDVTTTEIIATHDDRSRAYRWLFKALHTWDFPLIEPLFWRKLLIILGSIAGLTIAISGLLQGYKRLKKTL